MNDPLQAILQAGMGNTSYFPPTSRYYNIKTVTLETSDGKTVVFLQRRFLPAPDTLSLVQLHTVSQSERPDTIAARYLGDPLQFWRIADANNVMHPQELISEVGRRLRITQPEGIP